MVNGKVWNKDPEVRHWGYKTGEGCKKIISSPMAFNTAHSSALSPVTHCMETNSGINPITQAIAEAQEQLR